MKAPTISVIMATYNHADFVKQAIDSVLAQQGVDFEFLIADDGSTDLTREIVASIKDDRIRFFPNEVNRGACMVTNELIERATGEFIALINSDDYWIVPDKLAYQVQILQEKPHVGACFGRARFVDKEGLDIDKTTLPFGAVFDQENRTQGQWLRRFFDLGNCICHPTMLIRKSCYDELGMYNNRLRQLPDLDMWIRLVKRHEIFISDRELVNFRILPGENVSSQTTTNSIRTINEHYLIAEGFFDGVTKDRLIEGFLDLLLVKDVPSAEHLDIEKTRLFFVENPCLSKPYKMIGLLALLKLLNSSRHYKLLAFSYGIDDRWYQKEMAELDLFRPALIENSQLINDLSQSYAEALRTIEETHASSSWRITAPLRQSSIKIKNTINVTKLLPNIIRFGGGFTGTLNKANRVYSQEGWAGVKQRILFMGGHRVLGPLGDMIKPDPRLPAVDRNDYAEWVRRYDTLTDTDRKKIKSKIARFQVNPLISVMMPVYNPPAAFLDEAIQSVRNQLYPNWELCIADDASTHPAVHDILEYHSKQDARIKVVYREENGHISLASNSALGLAQGEFIALFDHDDLLTEHALYKVVEAINRHPDIGLIYSDEDKIDESNQRYDPYFKCQLNYELLLAQNMVSHLSVYRSNIIKSIGGFRVGFERAQAYDLVLRVTEQLKIEHIVHVPHVLYHRRVAIGGAILSVDKKPCAFEAGRKAVMDHLKRMGTTAEVMPAPKAPSFNRVRFSCPSPQPLVSIIIPTRDRADLLGMCLESLIQHTTYSNYEVIIIDNGSVEAETQRLFHRLPKDNFKILRDDSPFNYSALNNNAVHLASGELLCLMNNDIEILTPDWLEEMVSFAVRPDIGCVGARLWFPGGLLQHGGCVLGVGGVCGHSHKYFQQDNSGYFSRAILHQSFSAVTAACLLVSRPIFEQVGGLDEQLVVALNDIDFCLRVQEAGYRNVWTPYAEMNHHESATRGLEDTPAKQRLFAHEVRFMKSRWGEKLFNDSAYSPNLTLNYEDFSLAWPPRVPSL